MSSQPSPLRGRAELVLTLLLVMAAVVVAGSSVFGVVAQRGGIEDPPAPVIKYVAEWERGLPHGRLVFGADQAPLTILALVDLECGACAQFNRILKEVLPAFGDSVRVVYVHYPLRQHRFATPAANAAECAYRQAGATGFQRWVDLVYLKADSLGLKSWESYAGEADLPDPVGIHACAVRNEPDPVVTEGLAFGLQLEFLGLPMFFVNGWRLVGSPDPDELRRVLELVLKGRAPG